MLGVLIWVICGATAGALYQQRGRLQGIGAVGGFLLGPIGLVLALLPPTLSIECPHCAERIQASAKVCRYCGWNIPPELSGMAFSGKWWRNQLIYGGAVLMIIALCALVWWALFIPLDVLFRWK